MTSQAEAYLRPCQKYDIAFANVLHGPKYDLTFPRKYSSRATLNLQFCKNILKLPRKHPRLSLLIKQNS